MSAEHKAAKAVIQQHIAAWNNTDEATRKTAIDTLYTIDVKAADPEGKYKGREELNNAITGFQQHFPGAEISITNPVRIHHNGACYNWQLAVPGNPPVATGTDFVLLKDGLIKTLYVFTDK